MADKGRRSGKRGSGEGRSGPGPFGRVVLILLLVGLVWLVGKGVLTLWRMLSTGL
jgi:hypothetical protein